MLRKGTEFGLKERALSTLNQNIELFDKMQDFLENEWEQRNELRNYIIVRPSKKFLLDLGEITGFSRLRDEVLNGKDSSDFERNLKSILIFDESDKRLKTINEVPSSINILLGNVKIDMIRVYADVEKNKRNSYSELLEKKFREFRDSES
ncbi:MAG: hypothetical protein ACTSU5_05880 [Promethearchaeota archaeon]